MGYTKPTPIQEQAIPVIQSNKDLIACAQTGTGKTAAYILPILNKIIRTDHRHLNTLILAPTRELALQIDEAIRTFGAQSRLRTVVIIGGASRFKQVEAMRRGADIVIGTPGRVCDLLQTRELNLANARQFVLDEADRMLDLGFIRDIRKIVAMLPVKRQSALFSATMPAEVANLANGLLNNPTQVEIERVEATAPKIDQSVYHLPISGKLPLLGKLLEDSALSRVIVFTRTKHGANKVCETLETAGHRTNALHGNKSQPQREKALDQFRSGRARILVATDIAARGIDVTGITHVINYDVPVEPESYIHRIGRTARAGAAGHAITFCDGSERGTLRAIERLIGGPIPVAEGSGPPQPQTAPIDPRQQRNRGPKPNQGAKPAQAQRRPYVQRGVRSAA